jgi:hypothetical protein
MQPGSQGVLRAQIMPVADNSTKKYGHDRRVELKSINNHAYYCGFLLIDGKVVHIRHIFPDHFFFPEGILLREEFFLLSSGLLFGLLLI